WLVVGPDGSEATVEAALGEAIHPNDGAVVDVSASRTGLLLRGPNARDVLGTCCALDFEPPAFGAGRCAQTLVAKAPIIIQQRDDGPSFLILVRPSITAYVVGWLVEGMVGLGDSVSASTVPGN